MHKTNLTKFEQIRQISIDLIHEIGTDWRMYPCMEFSGSRKASGYGWLFDGETGRREVAHRSSFRISRGSIPEGHDVCHHCDNPSCYRPSHLFSGTAKDNIADAISKKRFVYFKPIRGEDRGDSKLTENQVREIRRLRMSGIRLCDIAKLFTGVRACTIEHVVHRRTWKHVE